MTSFDDEPDLAMTYDPETLHEHYADEAAARARTDVLRGEIRSAPDEIGELAARGELVERLRGIGELDDALDEANAAVDRAEIAGNAAQQHTARLRLAQVHQWRGEFAESNLLVTELLAAATSFGPVIEAFTRQQAGGNDYDQGHWADAREHFARALTIRDELELSEREASRVSLAAAERRLGPA
ncbi:hypothetical protein [Jatrophihabitans endophyticus]|uniref:hypothetical protein n=1 Tax=Jatrophihabitans endophyticus TaxID=1206085 RepID=UPI0019DFC696|nr:hypothetical protein [Jatrophihabitans endophyticus]MBE7188899.1 hypothetical protein [Jatrophihabitans endophyticus]